MLNETIFILCFCIGLFLILVDNEKTYTWIDSEIPFPYHTDVVLAKCFNLAFQIKLCLQFEPSTAIVPVMSDYNFRFQDKDGLSIFWRTVADRPKYSFVLETIIAANFNAAERLITSLPGDRTDAEICISDDCTKHHVEWQQV